MWFGLGFGFARLTFKIKFEPNQINVVWVGSAGVIFVETIQFFFQH